MIPLSRSGATSITSPPTASKRCLRSGIDCVIACWSRVIAAGGVPAGANSPIQESISRPGTPDSVMVRTSGACGFRFAVRIPMPLTWPRFDVIQRRRRGIEEEIDSSRPNVGIGQGRATVRNVQQLRSRDLHEGGADNVLPAANADSRKRQLAWILFRRRDDFFR